jgi:hypothetical protein
MQGMHPSVYPYPYMKGDAPKVMLVIGAGADKVSCGPRCPVTRWWPGLDVSPAAHATPRCAHPRSKRSRLRWDGMDRQSTLTTVDNDEIVFTIARCHFGDDPRVTFHLSEGAWFLETL